MKFWMCAVSIVMLCFWSGCSSDSSKKKPKEELNSSVTQESNATITTQESNTTEKKEEKKFDKITLKTTDGQEIIATQHAKGFLFSGYEDKVVLVNFFTTWCPPCKAEIPHLNNLQEKYKDKLVIISVLLEENKSNEEVANFIKYNRINFSITNSSENFQFAKSVGGVKNIPLMFLYDKQGNYSTHYLGAVPEEMLDTDIKKAL